MMYLEPKELLTKRRIEKLAIENGYREDMPEESGQICMLACILGNGGEVFFPKLGEDQVLTFSCICDKFVTANGLVKDTCSSDDEAKRKDAALAWDDNKYPTVYFGSDTTGEKAYDEFYFPGEKIDMQRFKALGVVC